MLPREHKNKSAVRVTECLSEHQGHSACLTVILLINWQAYFQAIINLIWEWINQFADQPQRRVKCVVWWRS